MDLRANSLPSRPILAPAWEQPLPSLGILPGGVEKAPRAGLGDNPNRPALFVSSEWQISGLDGAGTRRREKGGFRVECGILRLAESGGTA